MVAATAINGCLLFSLRVVMICKPQENPKISITSAAKLLVVGNHWRLSVCMVVASPCLTVNVMSLHTISLPQPSIQVRSAFAQALGILALAIC